MKQKLKLYLKIGILLFGIPLLIYNCNKDETIIEEEFKLSENSKSGLNIIITNYEHLKASNTSITTRFDKYLRNELSQARTDSNEYGFYIEEDKIQIIHKENYSTYTFVAKRENPEDNILENYMLKENNDGTYKQYLIKYEYTIDENENIIYNTEYLDMQIIDDPSLLASRAGCGPELIDANQVEVCFDVSCTGTNNHEPGDDECYCGTVYDCQQGYESCSDVWVYTTSNNCGGGDPSSDNTDGNNDGPNDPPVGGGGNAGNDDENTNDENSDPEEDEEEPIEVVPLDDDFGRRRECKKAMRFLENNPNFKTLLLGLNNDLDEGFEKSISKFENITPITVDQGTTNQAEVRLLTLPGYVYEGYAHTHYETDTTPEGDTYSVFSIEDLVGTAKIIDMDLADTGSFVMFLSTGKGTHYAMTINNKARFLKFFNYALNEKNPPSNFDEFNEWLDSKDLYIGLKNKFYNDEDAVIKKTNTDNEQVLEAFLQFMDEADMGATLLKTDENFNDFSRVRYKPNLGGNNIEEKPCNN